MNSLLKVHSLLFAFTLVSVAAPAFAITRIGNSKALQVASSVCQGKVFPDKLCSMIHCTDASAPLVSPNTTESLDSIKSLSDKDRLISSIFEVASMGDGRQICDKGTGKCK